MKMLVPLVIALLGLGAGIGGGLALKPKPAEPAAEAACPEHSETPCPVEEAHDPLAPAPHGVELEGEPVYIALDKPFVVPVFKNEKVVAMVVVSLSVTTDDEGMHVFDAVQPRLRDSFLKAMFRHANSGGFDGLFTTGRKMEDLKSALLASAREAMPHAPVSEVLITEIARQDT